MKCRCKIIFIVIILLQFLYMKQVASATLSRITVKNNINQATVILDCNVVPTYMIFDLHNPERIVIDFFRIYSINKKNILPLKFSGNNLIKRVRMSAPVQPHSIRIVLDLVCISNIGTVIQKRIGKNYRLILTLFKNKIFDEHANMASIYSKIYPIGINRVVNNKKNIVNTQFNNSNLNNSKKRSSAIVVAIDAGHGGQDPGATGYNGVYEKNITINIAKKLKILLDSDPMFSAVMIRDGDYFLSVMERSNIARKKGANALISIHTDSALNSNVKGASVWVLSNRRAKSEMVRLLQCSEKYSELLGGLGDVLNNYRNDFYFNHFILDLQFGHSQKVGYDIAMSVLHQLKNISFLHKDLPEYSSFGVLRAPDIPSILVEIGFISNVKEAYLLSNNGYQEKIVNALYRGLRAYFIAQLKKPLNNYSQIKNKYVITVS